MKRIFDELGSDNIYISNRKFIPPVDAHPDEKSEGEVILRQISKNK